MRKSGEQQVGTEAYNTGAYDTGSYDTGAYDSGAYDTGAYNTGAYDTGAYSGGAYGNTGTSYRSGYTTAGAPGKISFTLGGTGYQTGSSTGSGYGTTSAVSKKYGEQQVGTGAYNTGAYDTGSYDTGAYDSGAYDTGAYNTGAYDTGAYRGGAYGNTGTSYRSGYRTAGAPGKISFTLGGTGYQTGSSTGSGYGTTSAVSKPYGIYRQRTSSVRHSGAQGSVAPGKISFTQDFTRVSGQSAGIHRSSGIGGISTARKTVAPVTVVRDEFPTAVAGNTGSSFGSGAYEAGEVSGIGYQEIAGIGGQTVGTDYADGGVKIISSQVSPAVPRRSYVNKAVHRSGSTQGLRTTAGVLPQISFTQDFSKVRGQSGFVSNKPQIQSFNRVSSPVRPVIAPKATSGSYGQSGIIRRSGFLGSTVSQPRISFTQDFSRVRGQSQGYVSKPRVQSFNRVSSPVAVPGTVRQQPIAHGVDYIEKTGVHGHTGVGGHGNTFDIAHGVSGVQGSLSGFRPASFDAISTGGVSALPRQSSGSRYGSGLRRTSQTVPGVNPAKISFTQDFSRVSGRQTSGIKPAISTRNEIPAFPAVISSPVAPKPVRKPITEKLVFKAPKQPVIQQPTYTTIYDQSPVQGISSGAVESHFTTDKSSFSVEPVNTGFVREHVVDYKQEIANVGSLGGNKFSDIVYAPGPAAVYDKSSNYGYSGVPSSSSGLGNVASAYKFTSADNTGDKSNIYVAVPADGKSELVHSAGIAPSSGYAEEKSSYYEVTSGNTNSALPSLSGQTGYSAITTPFKSYYSSSYPGYSHVSGESPRFDFSNDRNLLYTYSSPYISSPFSYTYSIGKGQYDPVYGKSIA